MHILFVDEDYMMKVGSPSFLRVPDSCWPPERWLCKLMFMRLSIFDDAVNNMEILVCGCWGIVKRMSQFRFCLVVLCGF